jgi:class 3 adenylate cyclase
LEEVVVISEMMVEFDERVRRELKTPVEIEDCETFPDPEDLYLEKRCWMRMKDVVAVAADLKGSTKLNFDKHANTSARLYEALTGHMVRAVEEFEPEFVAIQGDGLFALFHGDMRYQRALCAAVTLKTFSERTFVPAVRELMSERFPDTGLKVGMDAGILVAKRVGVRNTNEPVWAGRPVNWAFKCAETAEAHQLVVTRTVFEKLEANDYIVYSCGCPNGSVSNLWTSTSVQGLPEEEGVECKVLKSDWCVKHGDEFCEAILDGKTSRPAMPGKAA